MLQRTVEFVPFSKHFVSGRRNKSPTDVDFIPSVFDFRTTGLKPEKYELDTTGTSEHTSAQSNPNPETSDQPLFTAETTQENSSRTPGILRRIIENLNDELLQVRQHHEAFILSLNTIIAQLTSKLEEQNAQHAVVISQLTSQLKNQNAKHVVVISQLKSKLKNQNVKHSVVISQLTSKLEDQHTNHAVVVSQLTSKLAEQNVKHVTIISQLTSQFENQEGKYEEIVKQNRMNQTVVESLKDELVKTYACTLRADQCTKSDENTRFFTGLPSREIFNAIFEYFEPFARKMRYWKGRNVEMKENILQSENKRQQGRKIDMKDQFFLTLCRLRRGFKVKELSCFYAVDPGTISRIFITWLRLLDAEIPVLFPQQSLKNITESNPPGVKIKYPNLYGILDCTEFVIETPSSVQAQSSCFSQYKHNTTFKVLYLASVTGMVLFVSPVYSGRCSDKHIVTDSGILECIPEDSEILADRGFEIEAECSLKNIKLHIPAFKGSRPQLTEAEVWDTEVIANCRIHVERAIRRVKTFHIFDKDLALSMSTTLSMIIRVTSYFQNFLPPNIKTAS